MIRVALLALTLVSCRTLERPYLMPSPSRAKAPAPEGELARFERAFAEAHGTEQSGFHLLIRNDEALRARLALIDHAERTLDLQYFIWHGDASGSLLLERVWQAADRGVRVRILVDDLEMQGGEHGVAVVDRHPNIEIRVYNPWQVRDRLGVAAGFEFVLSMRQLNHRMHNKAFIADNRVSIVGGRNHGDEYFGLKEKFNFNDLDVLSVGPVTRAVSRSFDEYWNGPRVITADIYGDAERETLEEIRAGLRRDLQAEPRLASFRPIDRRDWPEELAAIEAALIPGTARVVADSPAKEKGEFPKAYAEFFLTAKEEMLVVSAYFIPQQWGVDGIREDVERGVKIRILTNALGTNDVPVSNSGYKKYRRAILDVGAELYEARSDAAVKPDYEASPVQGKFLGLHSKVFVADRSRVYIGSLNLDPRSMYLNTEKGIWIESPALAEQTAQLIEKHMQPDNAWRVGYDEKGLYWEHDAEKVRSQPARGFGQRLADWFFTLLPLENQL
ncbi:MAG: phospholipase D family protein [Planctomycetota bacterium]